MTQSRAFRWGIRVVTVACVVGLLAPSAFAGSPHFVTASVSRTGDSLTAQFKEAGLGNEDQVHIVLSATAQCINPGSNKPKAANKMSVNAAGDFPVQNGRAQGTLTLTAVFQPSCSPPMSVQFTNVRLTDTTSGISKSFSGTF